MSFVEFGVLVALAQVGDVLHLQILRPASDVGNANSTDDALAPTEYPTT